MDCSARMRGARVALVLVVSLFAAALATAQISSGTLDGTVVDTQGERLPGVTVTVTNKTSGSERLTVTSATGEYRFLGLPPNDYTLTAKLEGFQTVRVEGVIVNVSTARTVDITLPVAAVEEVITVADVAPLINTEPSIGTVVSQEELENLPLNGRQFANLGTLAAGTSLGFNTDPTKPGQQVIALNGGIGRNVNYVIDGGDNMDDTIGGALQNFSIESVQEFRIQTTQYKAEFGRSTGGVLSVVTKTGGNAFDGSVFGFFRDDAFNEKTETERRAGADKAPFSRDQYGASIGGPIQRDKAHFFATYERTERDQSVTTNTGLFPQIDGRAVATPFTDELFTAKVTVDATAKQYLQVRYGYQKNEDKYNAIPTVTPDNFGTLTNEAQTILVGLTSQIGSDKFNELHVQWSEFDNSITSDSTTPTQYFPGGVVTGQNPNTPQGTFQEKLQIKDDFSFSRTIAGRRHDFKAGIEYIDEPELGGDFPSGLNGLFTRTADSVTAPISDITFFGGSFNFSTPNEQWRVYIQDDWQITDRLELNLGVRYDYTDVLELDQRPNAIWQTLSTQTQFDEFYFQDFRNGQGGVIDADDNDIAPRIGFTWDVKGDGEHLVRGGWGIYYDFPYTNATVLFPSAAVLSQFGVVFNVNNPTGILNPDGSFFQPGDPLPPNQLPGGANLAPAPNDVASPTLQTPYSTQVSLGYSTQIRPWLGFSAEAISIQYKDVPFRFRANPIYDSNADGVVDGADTRRFPAFGSFRLWYGKGRAEYQAINLNLRGRVSDHFEFQAFYTWSETDGNVLAGADEFRLTNTGHQPDLGGTARDASVNALNPLCDACFGPLNTDAEHRFTLSGVYRAPLGIVVSGVLRYRSGLPYTEHLGFDANGDGFNLDLAPGTSVNSRRGASFTQVDVRVSKQFDLPSGLSIEVIGEVFNLLDDENPAGFVGSQASPNFGRAQFFAGDSGQGEQRVAQLGLRLRF